MTNATPTGYGPRHRGLIFDGDESKYELWEIKFLGFIRLRKLSDTIDPRSDDARGELPGADEANNADAFAELIQCLDDRSLSLIMREARDDGRKALGILREHYLGRSKPRIIGLYHALCSLNMNNETTTDYILRAEQAAAALKTAGEEVSDALLIAMIIKGLPHTFSTFSALTSQKTDEPSVTEFQRLISKLKSHGMGNSIINWIEQWLKDRRQRVVVDGEVSSWKSVLSGVPQGSVLGPILLLVYINDLEEGVTGKILKFADDTKLFRKVKEIGDKQNLQDDIDKLVKWSEKWQMLFNFGKCKCLHTGSGNTGMNYEMGGTILSKTVKEKDLGVTMNANMKVSEQCRIAASKGNQVLGMIRRNITYKEKSLIIPLYKAIVRPHLEYCIQAWNPHLRKDVDMLEKIQRRATKLIPELRDLTYEERLKECGLTTLETRRVRGDQIEVFKILNGYENIDSNIFFEIKESKITRGHNYTLVKKQSRLDVRKFSFSQRTINIWNNLSTDCVHASSVNMFKNKIDKYLVKAGYT